MSAPTVRVVLIVEDEGLIRCQIADEYRSRGWHVLEAAEGERAIEALRGNHVDLLFTDIQLAGPITGWEVAEALRQHRPDAPVIYASAKAADSSRQVAGSLFFDKPYEPHTVIQASHKLVDEC